MSGEPDPHLYVLARRVLFDALEALEPHRDSVILIGAQAVYIHTGDSDMAVAPHTTDADLALDTTILDDAPLIESAMTTANFVMNKNGNPGAWVGKHDIQLDLMAAESQGGKKRGARIPPHDKKAVRNALGLEGALVDKEIHSIAALEKSDGRLFEIYVAGPAALLVAKLIKIGERRESPMRLKNKDALDVFRLLQAKTSKDIADRMVRIESDADATEVAQQAIALLRELFGSQDSLGCDMAVQALASLANPAEIRESLVILVNDLLVEIERSRVTFSIESARLVRG
jgi:hypothetical protein